ncbi:hypothetical protein [Fervidicoccus fontis]|uniref:Uncharacterized protein n=1 Tax=Fervidicoccus fontis TaxID=683846 RepID=A0A2J6N2M1_9CREN|nr:hypothetical protein [Fervidicoccus fontis]PMB75486.1 MAG: hypothetical protein C0188_03135 [Fervidicoccus fontis]PMB77351.1 MAG: hypothetical protein C0177_03575 [Fervidicoccus fontis]HEW64077.1 hypothetical protein [Fervidicoccus fontis]
MFKNIPNYPEIPVLRESGMIYPPVAFIIYMINPFVSPDVLFLYNIYLRANLEANKEIFVGSYGEDVENLVSVSSYPTPLISKLREFLSLTNIHYRYYTSIEEMIKSLELNFRSADHIYYYIPYLSENDEKMLFRLVQSVKKAKQNPNKNLTITFFIDENVIGNRNSYMLYDGDILFKAYFDEKTYRRYIKLIKMRFFEPRSINIEYVIDNDIIRFNLIRSL